MREVTLIRQLLGYEIKAVFMQTDSGVNVMLTGGSQPHIGAVTCAADGTFTTTVWESHKDDVISRQWAKTIGQTGIKPVVVCVGIHYPDATKTEIQMIVETTNEMLSDWISVAV